VQFHSEFPGFQHDFDLSFAAYLMNPDRPPIPGTAGAHIMITPPKEAAPEPPHDPKPHGA
jgi:hypothetical protein